MFAVDGGGRRVFTLSCRRINARARLIFNVLQLQKCATLAQYESINIEARARNDALSMSPKKLRAILVTCKLTTRDVPQPP